MFGILGVVFEMIQGTRALPFSTIFPTGAYQRGHGGAGAQAARRDEFVRGIP